MAEEAKQPKSQTEETTAEKPTAKPPAKKEKAPALEDKPFTEFIEQDYLPALKTALVKKGVNDLELKFAQEKFAVVGLDSEGKCWQVMGNFQQGKRRFSVYFPKESIHGQRAFSCSENTVKSSTIEPFLIDERKITLDLLVSRVVQRLNAQKWLSLN